MNRRLFSRTLKNVMRFSFSSKNDSSNVSIPPPPNPTVAESFSYKLSKKDLEKFMNPTGFLDQKDYEQYEGVTKEGKIVDAKVSTSSDNSKPDEKKEAKPELPKEYGFKVKGPEPTRYGDWERKGRCTDF
jgi:hypothetical protein